MRKKLVTACLTLLILALVFSQAALCVAPIDDAHPSSLRISYCDGSLKLTGVTFDIYRVASVSPGCTFSFDAAFAGFPVLYPTDLNSLDAGAWLTLADTMKGYVLSESIAPDRSDVTDSDGIIDFAPLDTGLYLVIGEVTTQYGATYIPQPFFASLPTLDTVSDSWAYDVNAQPKYSSIPVSVPTVNREVLKSWNDDGDTSSRPAKVTVQLLKDGTVYDTAELTAADLWRKVWTDLDSASDWTVVEVGAEGYTVTVTRTGATFNIVNTPVDVKPDPPGDPTPTPTPGPDSPQGGGDDYEEDDDYTEIDDENVPLAVLPWTGMLWWPVYVAVALGTVLVLLGIIRRRQDTQ